MSLSIEHLKKTILSIPLSSLHKTLWMKLRLLIYLPYNEKENLPGPNPFVPRDLSDIY